MCACVIQITSVVIFHPPIITYHKYIFHLLNIFCFTVLQTLRERWALGRKGAFISSLQELGLSLALKRVSNVRNSTLGVAVGL